MLYLETYLDTVADRGNVKLAESIFQTADEVGRKHIQTFSWTTHEIGLLFGNVQSGKTGQMFGIMCKAADLGFAVFVLLTTDNVVLQQQTLERVRNDIKGFCICGENDSGMFIENELRKPAIVVLKKNSRVLRLWANVFNSTGFIRGNALFVVDDEADAASLNTMVNKGKQSSINKYLETIIMSSSSSLYLQVTGTPQAILLQTIISGWHPLFAHYFKPGDGYLGGDFFFPVEGNASCIEYVDKLENPIRSVVIHHLAVAGMIAAAGGSVSNCLIHPSVRQAQHEKYASDVAKELRWCLDYLDKECMQLLQQEYNCLFPKKCGKPPFETVYQEVTAMLKHAAIRVFVMNGKNDIKSEYYSRGYNVIVGGNTLGRGVTFPGLHTIFYSRTSKNPQADTMWQHSRMFGYDRDPGLIKVFMDERLYKLFSDINSTNNSIISQMESGIKNIRIFYPDGINPTRKNVLDSRHVSIISGGTNYYPYAPDNNTIEKISEMLSAFSDSKPYYQVNLRIIKQILSCVIPSDDFNMKAFVSIIDSLLAENPAGQAILIVRRNRNVAQGTGALLSPNDWKLGGSFQENVVLTMYQVTGTKGWGGKQLWIPNIKLPHGLAYFDVEDDNLQSKGV